jgi:hypothetical protein
MIGGSSASAVCGVWLWRPGLKPLCGRGFIKIRYSRKFPTVPVLRYMCTYLIFILHNACTVIVILRTMSRSPVRHGSALKTRYTPLILLPRYLAR